ncbi:hypothetical protein [Fulvivirga ligni]|uniref:hypothetical protein n=1 Tax=Fulvivirga ligni TaxID=2904246 RepID=UPI001F2023DC|nr:hypothetical protein [Fulvivirga ligni]UII20564.1 hypothetical protein LVD16_22240 [Fulvivirga ligni]
MKIQFPIIVIAAVLACSDKQSSVAELTDQRIKRLINQFSQPDWPMVYTAKDTLESLEHRSLPYLFDMLTNDNTFVKLSNTADLIYPGATEFYGHGWVIDYDLDWLQIRAGWAIEDITFQNFGFREYKITEEILFEIEKDTALYTKYLETGTYDLKVSPDAKRKIKETTAKALQWWKENRLSWTRLEGIQGAIGSHDTRRVMDALQYLRFGDHCITGLDRGYFVEKIEPIIVELTESNNIDIREDARLILEDVHADNTEDEDGVKYFSELSDKCWQENILQQSI